jgi:hypothetical protein
MTPTFIQLYDIILCVVVNITLVQVQHQYKYFFYLPSSCENDLNIE